MVFCAALRPLPTFGGQPLRGLSMVPDGERIAFTLRRSEDVVKRLSILAATTNEVGADLSQRFVRERRRKGFIQQQHLPDGKRVAHEHASGRDAGGDDDSETALARPRLRRLL